MKKILGLIIVFTISLFGLELKDFVNTAKCDQIIDKNLFSICYSYKHKGALSGWTKINGKLAAKDGIKERPKFYEEESIPNRYRTKYSDYTGYGKDWNRGHIIVSDAEADYDYNELIKTYSMANIVPMSATLNQKTWTKVERYGRMVALKLGELDSITIIDYTNSDSSFNGITIPSDFYRIYYNNEHNFQKCFYYKNILDVDVVNDDLRDHEIDCNSIKI